MSGATMVSARVWDSLYVLAEASASCCFGTNWHAQLLVKNLFNKSTIIGSLNCSISMSTPVKPKSPQCYEFGKGDCRYVKFIRSRYAPY